MYFVVIFQENNGPENFFSPTPSGHLIHAFQDGNCSFFNLFYNPNNVNHPLKGTS